MCAKFRENETKTVSDLKKFDDTSVTYTIS